MKKIRKFLLVLFCMVLCSGMAVYADDASDYYSALTQTSSDREIAIQAGQSYMSAFAAMTLDDATYYMENATGFLQKAAEQYHSYLENDVLGEFKDIKSVEAEETKKGYDVTCTAEYENANLVMTMSCNYIGGQMTPTGIEFSVEENHSKSMGEKMQGAVLNTIIGLVTVFVVLILISFLISLFRYIPAIQEKFEARKRKETIVSTPMPETEEAEEQKELADDTELVAVITAAICAATGSSSDGFVVRSIRKSKRK